MKRKVAMLASLLIIIVISLAFFFTNNGGDLYRTSKTPLFVGVEYAYGYNNETSEVQLSELKLLVDKVKDYTNLFAIGSLGLTFNRSALTEACDYVVASQLNLIVLFTGFPEYNYTITDWMTEAKTKYGERFLGVYRYDEPGGHQLDGGPSQLLTRELVELNASYNYVAENFVGNLSVYPNYYLNYAPKVFTADYGLYWFDYMSNYSAVFAEFVGNESRERHIALCRGAAAAVNKEWGVIITWKYYQEPYLESPEELYNDLSLAYRNGAKYTIIFSYPKISSSDFGILNEDHFNQLERFWNDIHHNPEEFTSSTPEVAYIVPTDYGFGFRNPGDVIWGLFPADNLSKKIYTDVEKLIASYGSGVDILYDQPPLNVNVLQKYKGIFYWNQTIS